MTPEEKHIIFYKDIPIGEYGRLIDLRLYDMTDIYLDNIEHFDNEGEMQRNIETLLANLYEFLKGNLPGGVRFQVLTEMVRSTRVLDLIRGMDEFSADISLDRIDGRKFSKIPEHLQTAAEIGCKVPPQDFVFHASGRSSGTMPFAMAGYFDKFTAVLEDSPDGPSLRNADWQTEVGNVIVKPQGEQFPMIAVNEAMCLTLANMCGLETARSWTVSSDSGFGTTRHFVTERFGIRADGEDSVSRDIIFDTGMLLAETAIDQYSISSEKYFEFMKEILPPDEMKKFMNAYLFGYITGNSDMHVKNFSVKFTGGGFVLTPLYDLVSYKPYGMKNDLALTVRGNTHVTEDQFVGFMLERGMTQKDILDMTAAVRENFTKASEMVIDPENKREYVLSERIRDFTMKRCSAIEETIFRSYETGNER